MQIVDLVQDAADLDVQKRDGREVAPAQFADDVFRQFFALFIGFGGHSMTRTIYRDGRRGDVVVPKSIKGRARRLSLDVGHGDSPILILRPRLNGNAPLRVRVVEAHSQKEGPSPHRPLLRT